MSFCDTFVSMTDYLYFFTSVDRVCLFVCLQSFKVKSWKLNLCTNWSRGFILRNQRIPSFRSKQNSNTLQSLHVCVERLLCVHTVLCSTHCTVWYIQLLDVGQQITRAFPSDHHLWNSSLSNLELLTFCCFLFAHVLTINLCLFLLKNRYSVVLINEHIVNLLWYWWLIDHVLQSLS